MARGTDQAAAARPKAKRCSKCLKKKSRELFTRASRSPDGLHHWCRECASAYGKLARAIGLK